MLCQPLEDSLKRKENFIKVLNGPILVTIKNNHNQADLHLWLIQFSFIYTALNHNKYYFIALLIPNSKHNISTVNIYTGASQ